MTAHQLSADTQVVLLLCGSLGQAREAEPKPLAPAEYHRLAQTLLAADQRPADLLQPGGLDDVGAVSPALASDRLRALLDRGAALGLAVESWTNRGLWVISRSDEGYPARLKARLRGSAPPLLYGAGELGLLGGGGLVIVGSREVDEAGIAFAERVAVRCALDETTVISGGARGVDAAAMEMALASNGRVIGVLADGLARAALAKSYRDALRARRLALCSPYDPAAGFSVGNAMGRNRQIYALGDVALVVSASDGSGGTWAGAIENLKHGWVPLFVREGVGAPVGNRRLVEQGGRALADDDLPAGGRLLDWLSRPSNATSLAEPGDVTTGAHRPAEQLSLLPLLTAEGQSG